LRSWLSGVAHWENPYQEDMTNVLNILHDPTRIRSQIPFANEKWIFVVRGQSQEDFVGTNATSAMYS